MISDDRTEGKRNGVTPKRWPCRLRAGPRMYGTLFLYLSLVYYFIEEQWREFSIHSLLNTLLWLNQQSDIEFVRCGLWINNKHQDILNTILKLLNRKKWAKCWKKVLSLHSLHSLHGLHGLHGLQSAVCSLRGLRFGVTDLTMCYTK